MRYSMVATAAALLLGCSKPVPPTLTPLKASVAAITPVGIDLALELGATNPNGMDLSTQGVSARVVLDKRIDLGTVKVPTAVTFPAGQTTPFVVPVSLKWNDLASVLQLGASARAVPYTVDGTVTLGGRLLNVDVPFHLEGSATHDQIAKATLAGIPGLPSLP